MQIYLLFTIIFICFSNIVQAEVITDGSLNAPINLPGPHFQITADLGQQYGGNLFHSFQEFNLQSDESATFSGSSNITNIISRVTGGHPSNIDGLIRSTIPNADVYFLNPYGILFGPNAQLDVQSSFHASTADYLRLQDGGRFEARYPNNSLLTIAPIEAFGFLTDAPASIQTHSSKLSVSSDKTLSLIGGDLHLTSDVPLTADNSSIITIVASKSILATEHGRINLVSLAGHGEVIPSENDLILQGQGGKITIENTLVELSGHSGGATFIRAGQFFLSNAIIRSNTFGNQDGKDINLKVTEAAYLDGINSEITVTTTSMNNAGSIFIDVPYLEITNALINTGAVSSGKAGPIDIHANQVFLRDGALIASGAMGAGRSGDLTFNVTNHFSLSGYYPGFRLSHGQVFENMRSTIFSLSLGIEQSGNIWVNTQALNLNYGGILTDAYGTGQGGDITINAQSVRLVEGGIISSSTHQMAPAGNIKIQVAGQLYLAGWTPVAPTSFGRNWGIGYSLIESGTEGGNGKGGIVEIQADKVIVTEDAEIGADSSTETGEAGEVLIKANTLQLTKGGIITTSAQHSGGGDMHITVADQLYLHNGQLTTSVMGGIGNGGNITIEKPQFVILNKGQIKAQADEGHGGNIRIIAEQFVPSADSLISASSQKGISGEVMITSPENNIGNNLVILGTRSLNADQIKTLCSKQQAGEKPSSFVVTPLSGNPPSPEDDWQASSLKSANPRKN